MTVSRYFNQPDKLAEATRAKVEKAVAELGYVPNAAARTLLRGRSETLAFLLPDIINPFQTSILRGAEDMALKNNYVMFIGNTDGDSEKERLYIDNLIERRVDGVILNEGVTSKENITLLKQHNIATVLVDQPGEPYQLDSVRGDSYQAGRMLTQHLLDNKHSKLVFIGGNPNTPSLQERLQGYTDVMNEHQLNPVAYTRDFSSAAGYDLTYELFKNAQPYNTIIAASNSIGIGVLEALQDLNLRNNTSPVVVASFDNVDKHTSKLFKPFIAVAEQPTYDLGKHAVELLINRINGATQTPQTIILPFTLQT